MAKKVNLLGERFGRLVVVSLNKKTKSGSLWTVSCDCGNFSSVLTTHLKRGNVKSCGCLKEETKVRGSLSSTKEYSSYISMLGRCYGLQDISYIEKGRKVCDRWLDPVDGFFNFLEDMGERPENTTLERVNNLKGYEPENCIWQSLGKQCYNRNLFKNSTSGRTGVYYRKDTNKWRAKISFENETISLGQFDTYEEAVEAREKAEIEYYGFTKK